MAKTHPRTRPAARPRPALRDHPDLSYALIGLAEVALATADLTAALDHAQRALDLRTQGETSPTEVAAARFVLARVLWEANDHHRARDLAQAAADAYRQAGPAHTKPLVEVEQWLSEHAGEP